MKKVTILALHMGFGGIEKYISSLSNMLKDDFEIEIISTYRTMPKEAFSIPKNVKISYLLNYGPNKKEIIDSKYNPFKFIKEVCKGFNIIIKKYHLNIKTIKSLDSDYVITTRTFHNKLVSKYAKKTIVKIATEHNFHNNNSKYIKKLLDSIKKFDYFIVVSKELYSFYAKFNVKPKVIYIPNVIDNIPTSKALINSNNVISVGRLSNEKGFSDLIDIINIVKKDIPSIKLYLVGDGLLKKDLSHKIKDLNLEQNIELLGNKTSEEIQKLMLKSSLYLMTSYTESFGLVLLEANSCGLPCISFENSGANQLIHKNNGYIIKNRDKNKFASLIVKLLNDKQLIKDMQENVKANAMLYEKGKIKLEWLKILKK